MAVNNSGKVRFSLAWWSLLATAAVVALISCRGARAALEAGNATTPRRCHGGECLIAYRQPEVELMAVLDPEQALVSMVAALKPGEAVGSSGSQGNPADCGRTGPGRYTSCVPESNLDPHYNPYPRKA
ncbi:uncharacterized protein LOC115753443 [Rhodamnia argentea]|uniref:Uncharacterized protein LOC115753443 n=1 Tax=Rhodamnia argentea TaxID=178133 RepID=A0A8B8QLJ8_9MYRT|nr:uncharacterized protein LOC115753443 [Rhodamnia argentea]